MAGQVIGGWIIFFAGVLAVVVGIVLAAIKALFETLKSRGAGVTAATSLPDMGELVGKLIEALVKNPYGLLVVLGAVAIHLGLVMVNGGTFLGFMTLDDPTPAVSAG